jgi:hypothetical protein
MTIEQMVAKLAAAGWRIWHLAEWPTRGWHCRLYTNDYHPAAQELFPNKAGGSRGGWSRQGSGPTMLGAITDAARDIFSESDPKEVIDLDEMLR